MHPWLAHVQNKESESRVCWLIQTQTHYCSPFQRSKQGDHLNMVLMLIPGHCQDHKDIFMNFQGTFMVILRYIHGILLLFCPFQGLTLVANPLRRGWKRRRTYHLLNGIPGKPQAFSTFFFEYQLTFNQTPWLQLVWCWLWPKKKVVIQTTKPQPKVYSLQ